MSCHHLHHLSDGIRYADVSVQSAPDAGTVVSAWGAGVSAWCHSGPDLIVAGLVGLGFVARSKALVRSMLSWIAVSTELFT